MSLGLEVQKAFKEQITDNHRPLQFITEAAHAITNFITESVAASSNRTAKDLRSYFNATPKATVNTGHLYDSPCISQHHLRQLPVSIVWQTQHTMTAMYCMAFYLMTAVTSAYNCL